ncbi:MAG: phytanoyl-CoA dioxygenase family protein, partial [Acidimicrobiales bacterium]
MPARVAAVGDHDVEAFASAGAVCVRGVLDAGEVESAREAVDAVLASPGPLAIVASRPGDRGRFVEDFRRSADVPAIGRLAHAGRAPAVAAALMATPEVRFYHDHVLVKESGTEQPTPWHQDQPYYNVDGRGVSAWIALDHVPEEASLELVAGSHRGPWLLPRTFLDREARWWPEGTLAELPDIEADRAAWDIRRWALEPGDAVFFDFLTVHGAPGFPFGGRRRILSLRYLAAGATYAPRRWRTSPPFEELAGDLAAGDRMDHQGFPVVWPPPASHHVSP